MSALARSTEARGAETTTLHVDWTRCDGRGLCAELLPELLERDDWGYPRTRDGSRAITVPRGLREHAADAVAACPVLALRLSP
jgi:ferredoxin